jgi:hypothetical protein
MVSRTRAIEVPGGSNSTKSLYFLVALESALLTWLESLKLNSIDSWEDLKRAFIGNFQGSKIRAGTRHDLSQVKQEMNETLKSYTQHFFETHATIANITDEDVIHCFQNGLFSKTRRMRRMTASPSATITSKVMATATSIKASGTTRVTTESASQTMKSRLSSAIRVAIR